MLHQASCVALGSAEGKRALLIEGPSGSGKSSLALALLDRGARLVGDDGVTLEKRGTRLWASPPPNIEGLLEIRNVGLVRFEPTEAMVALILSLDPAAQRLPECPETVERGGCRIPLLRLDPRMSHLDLRAIHALQIHGLG